MSNALFLVCGSAVLLFALRWILHRSLTPVATVIGAQPEDLGLVAQRVRLPGDRGLSLFAWYVPARKKSAAPAVVLLHGWGGNASALLPAALALHRAGYAVLLPESRNHGRSDRDSHSSLPRFARDLECALDWLSAQPDVDANRLAAAGHSVGGAAVLLAASRRGDLRAVVSVSAFAHPESVMRRWLTARCVPYFPLGWMVNRYVERVIGDRFNAIAPATTLRQVTCPVLLMHGRQDTTVPLDEAHHLLERRGKADAVLIELEGTHEAFVDMELAHRELIAFLDRALKNKASNSVNERALCASLPLHS